MLSALGLTNMTKKCQQPRKLTQTHTLTQHRQTSPIALPGFSAVFVLGDAAVGREGILFLNVRYVEGPIWCQEKPVTWRERRRDDINICSWVSLASKNKISKSQLRTNFITLQLQISYSIQLVTESIIKLLQKSKSYNWRKKEKKTCQLSFIVTTFKNEHAYRYESIFEGYRK